MTLRNNLAERIAQFPELLGSFPRPYRKGLVLESLPWLPDSGKPEEGATPRITSHPFQNLIN